MSGFETERLRLRELTLDDAAFIVRLLNDPGWLQFIGARGVRTVDDARGYLERGPLKMYREHGFGLWLVETKAERTPTGLCGLLKRETLADIDLGYAFLPEFRGRGFALEAASATLSHAHQILGLNRVIALTAPINERSIALLERLGFRFECAIPFPTADKISQLYGWRAAAPA